MDKQITYKDAGVDIDAATAAVGRITGLARATFTPNVLTEIGSFGALFRADFGGMREPVLVSSADGVGTKLRVAFMTGIHNTVGEDLVNHCVNDILVQGARPLFFLDYFATGGLDPEVVVSVVEGVARGCRENGCALIGGETAEMPGFYASGEYDIAGFIVGVVDRPHVITGAAIAPGDVAIGLPSAGLHTNGYSLARKLLFEVAGYAPGDTPDELGGTSVGAALLAPHRSYLKPLGGLLETGHVKGLAHITGGGLVDNVPRILPEGTALEVALGSWPSQPLFDLLVRLGNLDREEAHRALNMGVGMVVVAAPEGAEAIEAHLDSLGEAHYRVGRIVEGDRTVRLV